MEEDWRVRSCSGCFVGVWLLWNSAGWYEAVLVDIEQCSHLGLVRGMGQ